MSLTASFALRARSERCAKLEPPSSSRAPPASQQAGPTVLKWSTEHENVRVRTYAFCNTTAGAPDGSPAPVSGACLPLRPKRRWV